jgi:hypothetical protein
MALPRGRRTARGEVNRLIDELVHPHFKRYPALILVDGLLHAAVEGDPEASLRKFLRYNAPMLLKYFTRRRK